MKIDLRDISRFLDFGRYFGFWILGGILDFWEGVLESEWSHFGGSES